MNNHKKSHFTSVPPSGRLKSKAQKVRGIQRTLGKDLAKKPRAFAEKKRKKAQQLGESPKSFMNRNGCHTAAFKLRSFIKKANTRNQGLGQSPRNVTKGGGGHVWLSTMNMCSSRGIKKFAITGGTQTILVEIHNGPGKVR